jgi:hypothetical protein
MGTEIEREHFGDPEYTRFERRVRDCLDALAELLTRPSFGEGPASLGAELELDLVDAHGRPAPVNRKVLAETMDPRVTLEIDRFNLEVNTHPVPLAGQPFTALAAELDDALSQVRRAAAAHGARVVSVGILPTLTEDDLHAGMITDRPRYRALVAGIERLRRTPAPVEIHGQDSIALSGADLAYEGANTSFQVHLRVPPSAFARTYNAAQLATAPVLAAAGNSPLFLGRRLWDETRVALFKQATDDRGEEDRDWRPARVSFGHGWARQGALELFSESIALHEPLLPVLDGEDPLAVVRAGGLPKLRELRLHNGTVWRWNRPVYDDADGGHLRVELRALPSGPTLVDMIGNAAWSVGLTLGLAPLVDGLLPGFTFGLARRNFYQAACRGLDAELLWIERPDERVRPFGVLALLEQLAPVARKGLVAGGVDPDEAERWLGVVLERARAGRTGARWQREVFERLARGGRPWPEVCAQLLDRYMAASDSGAPVSQWEVP